MPRRKSTGEDLLKMIQDAIPEVMKSLDLKEKGILAFNKILQENGFADSPYLKDYELKCEDRDGALEFILILDDKAIEAESRRKMHAETESKFQKESNLVKSKTDASKFRATYMRSPKGRPERIQGSRDARRQTIDARSFTKDARKNSSDRSRTQISKTSGQRYVDHEFNATAPRSMEVDEDGRLRITTQREIRNVKRKIIFPKGQYQGIVKKLLDEISDLMEKEFGKALEKELK